MPKVWNKRDKDIPDDAVYVGRPTKWGNPYMIGHYHPLKENRLMTRDDVIELYKSPTYFRQQGLDVMAKKELKGKDLICWCAPKPCHADYLLEVANEDT